MYLTDMRRLAAGDEAGHRPNHPSEALQEASSMSMILSRLIATCHTKNMLRQAVPTSSSTYQPKNMPKVCATAPLTSVHYAGALVIQQVNAESLVA